MKLKFYFIIFYLEFVILNKFKPLQKSVFKRVLSAFSNFILI